MPENRYVSYLIQAIVTAFVTILAFFIIQKPLLENTAAKRTFTVQGVGKVQKTPNLITTTYSIQEKGTTQKEAQDKGDEKQKKAMEILTSLGFQKEDIKTENYSVNEDYDYTPTGRTSHGFIISISTSIKSKQVEKINQALTRLTELGINVGGVNYSMGNDTSYDDEARKKAITDARKKADDLARAAGFRVGKIVSIQDGQQVGGPIPVMYEAKSMNMAARPAADIQPGSSDVIYNVSITYEIK